MLALFTSIKSQLSVAKAMANRATAMMDVIVAKLRVTAEHGILNEGKIATKQHQMNTKNTPNLGTKGDFNSGSC
jgi:hypothetical protein